MTSFRGNLFFYAGESAGLFSTSWPYDPSNVGEKSVKGGGNTWVCLVAGLVSTHSHKSMPYISVSISLRRLEIDVNGLPHYLVHIPRFISAILCFSGSFLLISVL